MGNPILVVDNNCEQFYAERTGHTVCPAGGVVGAFLVSVCLTSLLAMAATRIFPATKEVR